MAAIDLPTTITESQRLYSAWRVADAKWELARFDRPNPMDDLPPEVDGMHCDATHGALMDYLLHPADDLQELARKIRVFRQEDGTSFTRAAEVLEALENDAFDFAGLYSSRAKNVRRAA